MNFIIFTSKTTREIYWLVPDHTNELAELKTRESEGLCLHLLWDKNMACKNGIQIAFPVITAVTVLHTSSDILIVWNRAPSLISAWPFFFFQSRALLYFYMVYCVFAFALSVLHSQIPLVRVCVKFLFSQPILITKC